MPIHNMCLLLLDSLSVPSYFTLSEGLQQNQTAAEDIINTMKVLDNFLSEAEETSLMNELDPYMKKLRYEFDHWDNVTHLINVHQRDIRPVLYCRQSTVTGKQRD